MSTLIYLLRSCHVQVTREKQIYEERMTYEFCRAQNTEFENFAMQNEASVFGLLKAFKIGASHASQYERQTFKAQQKGSGYKEIVMKHALDFDIPAGNVLVEYREMTVCCLEFNDAVHLVHIPTSDLVIRTMDQAAIEDLTRHYHLDIPSWKIVASMFHHDIKMVDVEAMASQLRPEKVSLPAQLPPPAPKFPQGQFRLRSRMGPKVWCSSCKMWGLDAGPDSWWTCVSTEPDGEGGRYFRLQEVKHPHRVFCSSMKMWNPDKAGIDSWWEIEYGSSGKWFRLREKKRPYNYFCSSGKMWGKDAGDDSWWYILRT
ncbi:unnamed protein product [Symbiodinium pilosum]|uniref:Uncharacterized protein n=1 Tax=Symbiodinium pilosum TaxID=2952 RepID=A0A812YA01_SYMPI|nr:unnamed protein product [Symbiodinium pilosum]